MFFKKAYIQRLYVVIALYSLFSNFAHPVTPTFIQDLGLHDYMFGVAYACMSLTNFLFSPFWGQISRRVGHVKVLCVCYVGYALAQTVFGLASTEMMIIIARLLGGMFIGGVSVTQMLYIIDKSDSQTVGQNLAYSVTVSVVISAFGYMIGGLLGDIDIFFTFMAQAVGLLSTAMVCLALLKETDEVRAKVDIKEVLRESDPFKALVSSKKMMSVIVALFLGVCTLTSFASTSYEQCFNYFIKDQYGFPSSYNGLIKALVGIITLVANMTICRTLMKKTDITKTVIPILAMCFAMMVSIVIIGDVVPFILVNIIFFGFNAVYQPLLQATISLINKTDDGILVGLYNSMRSLGNVGGSLIAGLIYGLGAKMAFVMSATAFLLAAVIATMFYLSYRRQKALV